jgi:hypothetical protein
MPTYAGTDPSGAGTLLVCLAQPYGTTRRVKIPARNKYWHSSCYEAKNHLFYVDTQPGTSSEQFPKLSTKMQQGQHAAIIMKAELTKDRTRE